MRVGIVGALFCDTMQEGTVAPNEPLSTALSFKPDPMRVRLGGSVPVGQKKVLFVDDSSDWQLLISEWLREAGYDCVEATDAGQTIHLCEESPMDLMIVDVNMAGRDGFLTTLLNHNYPTVPIILCSDEKHDECAIRQML